MRTNRGKARSTAIILLAGVMAAFAGEFELGRYTIDGGGEVLTSGGDFELSGTIGQPDATARVLTGGEFEVTGGFWFRIVRGDCNVDGGINLFDFDEFSDCTTGPSGGPIADECLCADFDDDSDVDLLDFGRFQAAFTGP